ncbi:hypothetical protein CMI37_31685 [Candidatus Pacearchaeota archaeon]|nr:hypothetical protein [Candidatus Pacearchaeota archaeon]|tara:strand:- start:1014 stop:1595 length:582 start_codon:yes stop_codon:yes gene_type:complete
MTVAYKVKINGKVHDVSFVDGKKVYDPPLDSSTKKRDKERFNDMVESGQAFGCVTDSTFMAGVGTLDKQFEGDEVALDRIVETAKQKGYTPMPGDFYQPGLADYEGDPKAFVKSRADVRERCIERGVPCEGSVKVGEEEVPAQPERVIKKRVKLAKDIVARKLAQAKKRNPDLNVAQTRSEIIEKHGNNKHLD